MSFLLFFSIQGVANRIIDHVGSVIWRLGVQIALPALSADNLRAFIDDIDRAFTRAATALSATIEGIFNTARRTSGLLAWLTVIAASTANAA